MRYWYFRQRHRRKSARTRLPVAYFVDPKLPDGPPTMFIAGNDVAKTTVRGILESFGWDVLDVGGIEESRFIEPMAVLRIHYAFKTGTANHAFKMLRS